jgi:hypothetical protein
MHGIEVRVPKQRCLRFTDGFGLIHAPSEVLGVVRRCKPLEAPPGFHFHATKNASQITRLVV